MIGLANASLKIYVALEACDMRKSFNGLYDIVCQQFDDTRLTREALFVSTDKAVRPTGLMGASTDKLN